MRARSQAGGPQVFGADAVAREFGVVRGTYEAVRTLPGGGGGASEAAGAVPAVVCGGAGASIRKLLALESQARRGECTAGHGCAAPSAGLGQPCVPGAAATCGRSVGGHGMVNCSRRGSRLWSPARNAQHAPPGRSSQPANPPLPLAPACAEQPLPAELEFGEVLVVMLAAPVGANRHGMR
jgi:hypothetical protein